MHRLQGMCFGMLGEPASMGMMEGGSHSEEVRTASTGSVSRFESAGSAHAFDLDLGPLTSQPQGPHAVRVLYTCQALTQGFTLFVQRVGRSLDTDLGSTNGPSQILVTLS